MGGVEKRGGWTTSRMTPLPKRGFGPPSYGTFSTPLRCQCSVFPVQKSTTEQTRSSFGGVQKFSGERRSLVRFPPPIPLCTPPYHGPRFSRTRFKVPKLQCHAEGGATKGGVSKCEQTQTNADKRKKTQRPKTQPNANKHEQTWTNANKRLQPPLLQFFTPPFAISLKLMTPSFANRASGG